MITTTWNILCESAIYILIGFGIAGLLQAVISGDAVIRFLSGTKKRTVALATLIGVPLPLCSCSVLPAAMTLRNKGASRGATLAFLISTPETGVTSIMITYALLGPVMAIYRPIAACITAMVAGLAENFVEKRFPTRTPDAQAPPTSCCAAESPAPTRIDESRSCPSCHTKENGRRSGTRALVRNLQSAMRYAFVDLFDDIFAWILFGIVTAALIQVWLPPDVLGRVLGGPTQSMLLMVLIGVPLYVCAEASTPIAAALMLHGLNPGAALVLLLVGPATNIGSIGVLVRHLGRRTVVIYLTAIIVVALVMGGILNNMLVSSDINLDMRVMHEPHAPSWLKTAGALLFLGNGLATARRLRYRQRLAAWLRCLLPLPVCK